jgi:cob(I)alamin adenosyltransferase
LIVERHVTKGLVIVFTGDGKGKTSAALGIMLRAFGHKMSACMVQFIKSPLATGEALALGRLGPELELIPLGKGFVNGAENKVPLSEHRKAAEKALSIARERMSSGPCDILILDEINNAVQLGLVELNAVLELVRAKPPDLHLVLTGRDAHPELIANADMVTEMRAVKHPYDSGAPAQKGIDY